MTAEPVHYLRLCDGDRVPDCGPRPFKAVLVAEQPVRDAWRDVVCGWLVASGCLYCVAWGEACEAWHDAVDAANIADCAGRDMPHDGLVMTTWHDAGPLADAIWFAAACAAHPTIALPDTLIVHVGPDDRGAELITLYRAAARDAGN